MTTDEGTPDKKKNNHVKEAEHEAAEIPPEKAKKIRQPRKPRTAPTKSGAKGRKSAGAGRSTRPRKVEASFDEIQLRAYYLGEERQRRGEAANPEQDWVEAEREVTGKSNGKSRARSRSKAKNKAKAG